ncbi:MAG: hypothetical protein ACREBC_32780, partial [Pyrinomonadaceae bacterium]
MAKKEHSYPQITQIKILPRSALNNLRNLWIETKVRRSLAAARLLFDSPSHVSFVHHENRLENLCERFSQGGAFRTMPNRDDAWQLLCEYTKGDSPRKHALAVEAAMRAAAKRYGEADADVSIALNRRYEALLAAAVPMESRARSG